MNIKEASERLQIPKETLRYWENNGLIPPVPRNRSGYREYTEREMKWALFIKAMRNAGISVDSLIKFVRLYHRQDDTKADQKALIEQQYDQLRNKRDDLDRTLNYLKYKLDHFEDHIVPFLEEEAYYDRHKGRIMNPDSGEHKQNPRD